MEQCGVPRSIQLEVTVGVCVRPVAGHLWKYDVVVSLHIFNVGCFFRLEGAFFQVGTTRRESGNLF